MTAGTDVRSLVALASAALLLSVTLPGPTAEAQADSPAWVLTGTVVNPDEQAPPDRHAVEASTQGIRWERTDAPTAVFDMGFALPPERLEPGRDYELDAQVSGRITGGTDTQGYRTGTLILLVDGRWDGQAIEVEQHCADPIGAEPISCTDPASQTGTFHVSAPPAPAAGSSEIFTVGFGVLNCGGACVVRFDYELRSPTAESSTTAAPSTSVGDDARRSLCAEAVALLEGFDQDELREAGLDDPSVTGLRVDGDELLADFQAAIARYDAAHPGANAYVSNGTPFASEVGALNWLFANGGGVKGSAAKAFVTGTERRLQGRIIERAQELGSRDAPARLGPGEVLELALEENDGHLNQALLAAHNLLRTSARNDTDASPGVLADNGAFIDRYLLRLRDAENGGPWYHLFGTAYYEVVAQGDWGPWLTAGGALAAFGTGMFSGGATVVIGGAALAWQHTGDTAETTAASRVANGFEQFVREQWTGRAPDPEKFCFNVWGAQIGATLYDRLPYRSTRSLRRLFSTYPEPDPVPDAGPLPSPARARFITALGSPFSAWWTDGTARVLLDQDGSLDARLLGAVPGLLVLPVAEDGDSWGAVWMEANDGAGVVSFEATRSDAVLRLTRTDLRSGDTAHYEAAARRAGEQFSMELDPGSLAPSLVREDGEVITPELEQLELPDAEAVAAAFAPGEATDASTGGASEAAGSPTSTEDSEGSDLPVAAAIALVVVGAAAFVLRRGRRRRGQR